MGELRRRNLRQPYKGSTEPPEYGLYRPTCNEGDARLDQHDRTAEPRGRAVEPERGSPRIGRPDRPRKSDLRTERLRAGCAAPVPPEVRLPAPRPQPRRG